MRQQTVIGNWKMNTNLDQAKSLLSSIADHKKNSEVYLAICAPYTHLAILNHLNLGVPIGAQDCSAHVSGAFTGECSAEMISSAGAELVILGHSERRKYHQETEDILIKKLERALEQNLKIVYCIGETLQQRESGQLEEVISHQLKNGPFQLRKKDWAQIILAYEPVWAIGTGVTASPDQAQQVHALIRSEIEHQYQADIAKGTTILYGGSCKPNNASDLFSQKDIDGGLIGGASLNSEDFLAIANSF
jgi:triosephosphate isomerase